MNIEMTSEQIADLGKTWGNTYLSSLPAEEILARFKPQERLVGLKPQEIFAGLSPQELDELQDYLKKREQEK